MWKIFQNAYGTPEVIGGFKTKREAVSYAQCTRGTDAAPRKIAPGVYELLGRDLIIRMEVEA